MSKQLSAALTAFAEAVETLAAAFSSAGGDDSGAAVNGKAAKPAARAGSSAKVGKGAKPAAVEADADAIDIDIDTVREKMKELVEAKGADALLEAFAAVGAGKLADVDESQYQELIDEAQKLIDAEDEVETKPAAKKTAAKGKAKKGPTLDEVQEAAKALIEADKPAYMKLAKKLGKPSEMDESDYAAAIEAYEGAMPEVEAEEDLL